jgi:hypothetical protein
MDCTSNIWERFGKEGYQTLLGHSMEMGIIFRNIINQNTDKGLYIVNQEPFGCDTFIRCYQRGLDPKKIYKLEMNNDNILNQNNSHTTEFAYWLYKNKTKGEDGFAVSRSKAAICTNTGSPMVGLRVYPLNPYINHKTIKLLAERIINSKIEFDNKYKNGYATKRKSNK